MAEHTCQAATESLLRYYKIRPLLVCIGEQQEDIERSLQGTGLVVRALRKSGTALGVGVDGALLCTHDGHWFAVIREEGAAFLLGETGQPQRVLTEDDLKAVRSGWVLQKNKFKSKTIYAFYRNNHKVVLQLLTCGFITNVFALSLPLFSSFVYDKILGNGIKETLWALATGLFLIAIIDFSVKTVRAHIAERFAIRSETDIDRNVFDGLLSADAQTLPSVGRFLDRYKRLLANRDFLSSTYLLSLVDIPFLLLFLLCIAYAAGPLVFVPLVYGGLMLLFSVISTVPAFDHERKSRHADEQRFRVLTDLLASHEVIISSFMRYEFAAKWRDACANVSSHLSLSRYWKTMGLTFASSLAFLSYITVIIGGVYMVDALTLTSGGLLAASMLSSRAMSSFSSIITLVTRYTDFRSALVEMNKILPDQDENQSSQVTPQLKGHLSFDHVTCRLGESKNPVLSSINLRIDHGEMVGIAGMPGAGKTTLLRLIAGILQPESGSVLIDHYPVSQLSCDAIAQTIGYKPQDFCLVEGTIEDNIRAGGKPLTPEQREYILKASGLGWVFQQGGLNWSTQVGSRGTYLSGGQRQLVSLARALMYNRPILLLDEPTNGLDVQLENHLAKQLVACKGHATIIVSTHSRQLLSVCDRIIAVGDSRILADGPREKILVA